MVQPCKVVQHSKQGVFTVQAAPAAMSSELAEQEAGQGVGAADKEKELGAAAKRRKADERAAEKELRVKRETIENEILEMFLEGGSKEEAVSEDVPKRLIQNASHNKERIHSHEPQ